MNNDIISIIVLTCVCWFFFSIAASIELENNRGTATIFAAKNAVKLFLFPIIAICVTPMVLFDGLFKKSEEEDQLADRRLFRKW